MSNKTNAVLHVAHMKLSHFCKGSAYESDDVSLSDKLGLSKIGAVYSEVPPGKSGCPFHVHHVQDEMFVVLEGEGEYRFGDKTYKVGKGDVLGAPCGGPEYAHKLTNTGKETLKYLSISNKSDMEVCEYPDSGKFLVYSRQSDEENSGFRYIGREENGSDYWDGEDGAE